MLFANVMLGFKEETVLRHGPGLEHPVRVQFSAKLKAGAGEKRERKSRRNFPLLKYFLPFTVQDAFPRMSSHMKFDFDSHSF